MGLFGGNNSGDKAREEEEARAKREAERAAAREEERQAEREALRQMQEEARKQREEEQAKAAEEARARIESAGSMEMRGEETTSGEGDQLGRLEDEPDPEPPVIELEPQVIEVPGVSIPEDEIEVTSFAAPTPEIPEDVPASTEASPSPLAAPIPAQVAPQSQGPTGDPSLSTTDRVYDIAVAQGSQQPMWEQGYGEAPPGAAPAAPPDEMQAQRAALQAMQAESGANLDSPAQSAATFQAPKPIAPEVGVDAPRDPGLLELQASADQTNAEAQQRAEELQRAQRRDRILKVLKGLFGAAAGVGGAVAAARGNPVGRIAAGGVGGLGRVIGAAGGHGDDTEARQRGTRIDEQFGFRQNQAADTSRRQNRQMDLTEEQMATRNALQRMQLDQRAQESDREARLADELAPLERAQRRAQLERIQAQTEEQRRETALAQASNDPASDRSRRAQQRVVENLDTLRARGLNRTEEDILAMSEKELLVETNALGRAASSRQRTRGTGGGRRARNRQIPIPDSIRTRVADEYPDATPEQQQAIARRVMDEEGTDYLTSTDARQAARERRDEQGRTQVSNFTLREGAAPPDNETFRKIQDDLAALTTIDRQLEEMATLVENADWRDAGRSLTGMNNAATGRYTVLRDRVMSSIQAMSGGGVLTDGDVERLSALVPSLEKGWAFGGEHSLRAIRQDATETTRERMNARGFDYGSRSSSAGGDVQIRYRRNGTEGTTTIPRNQLNRLRNTPGVELLEVME